MRKILVLLLLFVFALGCGSKGNQAVTGKKSKGELVGVQAKKYYPEKPFGMVLIPGGSFIMGKSDDDLPSLGDAPTKTVTVKSYYMDETEITNAEYRQFVYWVRDSVIRTELAKIAMDSDDQEDPMWKYRYKNVKEKDQSEEDPAADTEFNYYTDSDFAVDKNILDWDVELFFDPTQYPAELYAEVMEREDDGIYIADSLTWNNKRALNVKMLKYEFFEKDIQGYYDAIEDVVSEGGDAKDVQVSDYNRRETIEIYPDTAVWIVDFKYSYNEPMHAHYFTHDAFSNYPVVGITWEQANAFCQWRTDTKNAYQKTKKKKSLVPEFRLPTEAEWEYAARGGLQSAMYPWGGPYTKNDRGCFMANFKPMRGDYAVDQALYTVEADAYDPNGYNLYNMSGNVSEWVASSYEQDAYEFSSTMNPNVNNKGNKKKIIRGGSWKDVKYFLQVSSRDYEYKDQARSYIGFRTVHDYLGTDMTANAMTNATTKKRNNKRSSIK
tara:strand:+ start:1 stop:1482 length:1482 start_codon:yes stop_codon:yes gene_type:complete